jgi:hypothetical protein
MAIRGPARQPYGKDFSVGREHLVGTPMPKLDDPGFTQWYLANRGRQKRALATSAEHQQDEREEYARPEYRKDY